MSASAKIAAEIITPGSPEWLMARAGKIGASDAPACLGWSRWRSPAELAKRIRAALAGTYQPEPTNAQQHRGHVLEPIVLMLYMRAKAVDVLPAPWACHEMLEWMAATPDGLIGVDGQSEAKTHNAYVAHQYGPSGSQEYPDGEFIQVQHQLAVTGRAWCDLVVLLAEEETMDFMVRAIEAGAPLEQIAAISSGMDVRYYRIHRDEKVISDLIEAEQAFWDRYIVAGEEAPDIKAMKPRDAVRQATAEEADLLGRLIAAYNLNKDSKKALEELRPQVEDAIGGDSGIECPMGKITWKATAASEDKVTNWEGIALELITGMKLKQDAIDALMADHTETVQEGGGRRFCVYPAGRKRGKKS